MAEDPYRKSLNKMRELLIILKIQINVKPEWIKPTRPTL